MLLLAVRSLLHETRHRVYTVAMAFYSGAYAAKVKTLRNRTMKMAKNKRIEKNEMLDAIRSALMLLVCCVRS